MNVFWLNMVQYILVYCMCWTVLYFHLWFCFNCDKYFAMHVSHSSGWYTLVVDFPYHAHYSALYLLSIQVPNTELLETKLARVCKLRRERMRKDRNKCLTGSEQDWHKLGMTTWKITFRQAWDICLCIRSRKNVDRFIILHQLH